jgi:NAD(P)-dependent dehydrogenase (short-subunit alcohol dehydrogenase family)
VCCHVVAAVRDVAKTEAALDGADRYPRIDLLINNAGVMATPLMRTAQGFELPLGTHYLGHFVFTDTVLARLGEGSRIVKLTSPELTGRGYAPHAVDPAQASRLGDWWVRQVRSSD